MRKLADYAFMLRDFKLAASTYDLLRADFDTDKAWKYYAGANEMAAISTLMHTQAMTSKSRAETIDRMLEGATHSYIHRCASPFYALRTLAISVELLKLRGSSAADDAARWAGRIIDNGLVGDIGRPLFMERISACYLSRQGVGSMSWGSRKRKAALWAVLAADAFLKLEKTVQAEKCLEEANKIYSLKNEGDFALAFDGMRDFLDRLRESIVAARLSAQGFDGTNDGDEDSQEETIVEEVSETLDSRPHRHSLIGNVGPLDPLGVAPISPLMARHDDDVPPKDDHFEEVQRD
jgi:hypothetical protein